MTSMAIGSLFGDRYRVESLIGVGGMASVYRARDESLGRLVALKVLSGDGTAEDTAGAQRQRNEVRLLASLSHPSLVTLFDAAPLATDSSNEAHLCLVMELVDGPNLGERIALGVVESSDAAHLTADLAEALHVVHQSGIVHRDIKPANVLLAESALPDREFHAKLADFGIASLVDSTGITATGTIIGTAAFLSPEQALGRTVTAATDIYSLGLVMLEALTGRREFAGSMAETVSARLGRDPHVPAELGADWGELLSAMTAREPGDRPTALEVSMAARRIPAAQSAAPTALLDTPTEVLTDNTGGATALLPEPTALLPATAAMAETAVMPANATTPDVTAQATEVLPGSRPPAPPAPVAVPGRTRRPPRPVLWAIAAAAVVLVLALIVIPRLATTTEPPSQTGTVGTELPANEGDLGEHLQQLLESVTP